MSSAIQHRSADLARRRVQRCGPFLAVAFCFLLPFFSASACGSGVTTDATGAQIIAGSHLVSSSSGPGLMGSGVELDADGNDTGAQAVADAARPAAIAALALIVLGALLVVTLNRYWRLAGGVAALAALLALVVMGASLGATEETVTPEPGLVMAVVGLLATAIWEFGVLLYQHAYAPSQERPEPLRPRTF
jgi:lysylphosphatidylglycerol synthetase-like protein (DUF2156 family)